MDKIGLIIGLMLGIYGLFKIDYILYLGLNYFGKYVFFGLFNIAVVYIFLVLYENLKGALRIVAPVVFGIILLYIGVKID
ncbi:MAG: hypothetical protein GXO62_02580 [Epsilonproteobacteria bacterium]|nr:hypothetical protein [Campylobacterota bacterium]